MLDLERLAALVLCLHRMVNLIDVGLTGYCHQLTQLNKSVPGTVCGLHISRWDGLDSHCCVGVLLSK